MTLIHDSDGRQWPQTLLSPPSYVRLEGPHDFVKVVTPAGAVVVEVRDGEVSVTADSGIAINGRKV